MRNNSLPLDLQYLFQNECLDSVKILVILYQFKRRRKGIILDELNYYYTLIDLLQIDSVQKYRFDQEYYQDNYFINEGILRRYSILLKNQELIEIAVEKTEKKTILYFKPTNSGIQLVESLKDNYFEIITDKCDFAIKTMKYSTANQRKALSRDEE